MHVDQLPKKKIRAVFTDLDGTLTLGPKLKASTLLALEQLKAAGFFVVILSGRPAGWADCLMRLSPIDAMVFENGAGLVVRSSDQGLKVEKLAEETSLSTQRKTLQGVLDHLKQRIPEIKLASDQAYRLYDYAIDYAEQKPYLDEPTVDWILTELAKQSEITFKLSNIHINYWVGKHTKITACDRLLSLFSLSLDEIVFVGDSPNDEPLFAHFPNSVGVANVRPFLPKMKTGPTYFTHSEGGQGFEELAALFC